MKFTRMDYGGEETEAEKMGGRKMKKGDKKMMKRMSKRRGRRKSSRY